MLRRTFEHLPRLFLLLSSLAPAACPAATLEEGFTRPPRDARIRAYWWWLNGNVTKAAITRDLEQMQAKGFGGALICDAGGYEQDGNGPVPAGPPFFSPEWRELYKHTLREADRLGLEMSLNIQSGWNLGGPMIKAEQAPKKIVWSETRIKGPAKFDAALPEPQHPPAFYRDIAVIAYPLRRGAGPWIAPPSLRASSEQSGHRIADAADGNPDTFWVSSGGEPGEGPTPEKPQWIQLDFAQPVAPATVVIRGRPGYGPCEGEWRASDDAKNWKQRIPFKTSEKEDVRIDTEGAPASHFRLVIFRSLDPRFPEKPRNVQVAEIDLLAPDGKPIAPVRRTLQSWQQKALLKPAGRSAPDCSPLLRDLPAQPGEQDAAARDVVEITPNLAAGGRLRWDVPAGDWEILRFGCTLSDHCEVSTSSDTWKGYAIDPLDPALLRLYWDAIVDPLIDDAGPLAGRTLKFLHTDSWEIEPFNWTHALPDEFRKRRGYDMMPLFPVLAGRLIDSRDASNRFLEDFRKTVGDLVVDHHFRVFAQLAHERGLSIHPESGGPHAVPIDSLACLGINDVPMSEFWARSWRHRTTDEDRFFVKQPASAAHTCGRRIVAAEGFTTIGPHWQEVPSNNLKPSFDRALCEGLNLLVWHAFTCSPAEMGLPGQEYFAGTHFNPNATWWDKSAPFIAYLNRCQFLLQQGAFVADACYYYGDHVPNFTQLKASDPAHVLPGYDYDVVTEDVILSRMSVRDGRLVLEPRPDDPPGAAAALAGVSYRLLVLPDLSAISLPVLRKLRDMVASGATVIGDRPARASGLSGFPASDTEVAAIANELWQAPAAKGRVISDHTAREVLLAADVLPDFESGRTEPRIEYIHRRDRDTEIYFLSSPSDKPRPATCTFRVSGKTPELWNPIDGSIRALPSWSANGARTTVPLRFDAYGSMFVLFRKTASPPTASPPRNFPEWQPLLDISGGWTVSFAAEPALPNPVTFATLASWTTNSDPAIRNFSGTATYRTTFELPAQPAPGFAQDGRTPVSLELGDVRELAHVRLNGQDLGILWSIPFRADATAALRTGTNELEVEIVNFWPNRIIGDAALPPEKRRTRTNIRKLAADTPLIPSGLLGPVRLLSLAPPRSIPAQITPKETQ